MPFASFWPPQPKAAASGCKVCNVLRTKTPPFGGKRKDQADREDELKKPGVAKAGKPAEAEQSEDFEKNKKNKKCIRLARQVIAVGWHDGCSQGAGSPPFS